MKPSAILRAARARIEDPERWCQGEMYSKNKTRCCAVGALYLASSDDDGYERWKARDFLSVGTAGLGVINYNDTHTHAEVLQLFDRAIAAAEGAGE